MNNKTNYEKELDIVFESLNLFEDINSRKVKDALNNLCDDAINIGEGIIADSYKTVSEHVEAFESVIYNSKKNRERCAVIRAAFDNLAKAVKIKDWESLYEGVIY